MRASLWPAIALGVSLSASTLVAQTAAPAISSGGIFNAASLAADSANVAAPGGLVSIFGKNLATTTATAGSAPLPRELNGTAVLVGNVFAPLLLISPTQINAQIPLEILPGTTASLVVWVNGQASASASLRVESSAPGIFTLAGNGAGPALLRHADSTLVNSSSPAIPGEEIQILCTGLGVTLTSATAPQLTSGAVGSGQPSLLVPTATIGDKSARVSSSVAASGLVGQYTVKVVVPDVEAGDQALTLTVGGRTTQAAVTLPVGAPGALPGGPPGTAQVLPPTIFAGGIVNAASLELAPNNAASPGGLVSIFGNNLATTTSSAGTPPLPRELAGTSVFIGGVSAPLLLVSPTQINAQVPFEIPGNSTVDVTVVVNGRRSQPEKLQVITAAPGIFTLSGSAAGAARVLHADQSPVTNSAPALPGEEIVILSTGLGVTLSTSSLPAVKTGEAGNGQLTVVSPTVTIGSKDARVTFAGAAPGLVGQYQVKVIVPEVAALDQEIVLTVGEKKSRIGVTLRIGFPFALPSSFSRMRIDGTYPFFTNPTGFKIKVNVPDEKDPTKTKEVDTIATVTRSVPCHIDLAGTQGPSYSAVVECADTANLSDFIAFKFWLKDGFFVNNQLIFTTLLKDPGTVNHFFFNGPSQIQPPGLPGTVIFNAQSTITEAVIDLNFSPDQGFVNGASVVILLQVKLALDDIGLHGIFSGTVNFVQP